MELEPAKMFESFLNKEIEPAIEEIAALKKDASRRHIQKLLYTNVVDRFDSMIDYCILENCEAEYFRGRALKVADSPITEAQLIEYLLHGDKLNDVLRDRLQEGLRTRLLRERHSAKVNHLVLATKPDEKWFFNELRVDPNKGKIHESKIANHNKKIPQSVIGYADWLYSRRNALVHGGTNKFNATDRKYIKEKWKIDLSDSFTISLGSLRTALKFYSDVVVKLREN
ncbi:hypothetical protein [Roseovarius sp.]|uniref:hypothetical protein n=1 Tax=Roseovarius sp. TaxID=1486281 RepID=UPI003D0D915C